jgi:hypothetical protein
LRKKLLLFVARASARLRKNHDDFCHDDSYLMPKTSLNSLMWRSACSARLGAAG